MMMQPDEIGMVAKAALPANLPYPEPVTADVDAGSDRQSIHPECAAEPLVPRGGGVSGIGAGSDAQKQRVESMIFNWGFLKDMIRHAALHPIFAVTRGVACGSTPRFNIFHAEVHLGPLEPQVTSPWRSERSGGFGSKTLGRRGTCLG